jgi:3-oxo-5-alpha-steroid 4-dehydrogenase 3
MDLATLCKAFFTLGTAVNIGGTLIPSFRQHIMNYGSRRSDTSPSKADGPKNQITELFDFVGSFQVPHTWFIHYYLVSVASSIFWAVQILCKGRVFEFFPSYSQQSTSGMTVNQVFLAWLFMMLQGTRRLYECITLTKPSQSKMWIGIWLIGIVYYLVIGISIWIEGISKCIHSQHTP